MKDIDQYATLKDFTDDIDAAAHHFPFKIMGRKGATGPYYTASMLAAVYSEIADPDQIHGYQTIPTPFGEILRKGCRLWGGSQTYSQSMIPNAKSGGNIFQADLIEIDLSENGSLFPRQRLAMVLTHSCGIDNSGLLNLVPIYLESELTESVITHLRGSPAKNPSAVRGNWLSNESIYFLGLPAAEAPGASGDGERLLACLNFATLIPKSTITVEPCLRLTYRALAYLQFRLALLYLRDVQDSDETRDF